MTAFILPSEPFNNKKPDLAYEEEYNLLRSKGTKVYLFDIEDIEQTKIWPHFEGEPLLYRGWMLSEDKYCALNRKANNCLVVSPHDYLRNHHIINWYKSIQEYTFETHFTPLDNALNTFNKLGWDRAFVKDYVKSIKTGKGSIVESSEDIERLQRDMLQYKGFIEGGLVLRRVEEFDKSSETRFFVLNGEIFYPNNTAPGMIELAHEIVQLHSNFFYTIDIVAQNNSYKVIEIGDGQVSDCVGYNVKEFINIFDSLKAKNVLRKNIC